ncbi:MAG: hypothetical protein R3249_03470 [Nitriliruptorales bacterium]|nr:hypothetical protein [Nitriliruptorales bacterium]
MGDVDDLWICPSCGGRFVTPNMWHSCGVHSLQELFARSTDDALSLAEEYVAILHGLGDVQVIAQKTRLVAVARVRFAGLEPREHGFRATFALRRWVDSDRIVKKEHHNDRWRGHVVDVRAVGDLDDELRGWLQESHDTVGLQRD